MQGSRMNLQQWKKPQISGQLTLNIFNEDNLVTVEDCANTTLRKVKNRRLKRH